MNIVLFGSTDLTHTVGEYLRRNNYNIALVVTVPQTFKISYCPKGVRNSRYADMSKWAKANNIPVVIYENTNQTIAAIEALGVANLFGIVVGWYHMIPRKLRETLTIGCSGFHASVLPRLRGGAPLNWAILKDFKSTGVSFFELADGVDNGELYDQQEFPIEPGDYVGDLVVKSEKAILDMLERTLPKIKRGGYSTFLQSGNPSYCGQRQPEDGVINWTDSVDSICKLIRASSRPYPGARSFIDGTEVIIWKAKPAAVEIHGVPGHITSLDNSVYISCGNGAIVLEEYTNEDLLLKGNHKRLVSSKRGNQKL